MTRGTHGFYVDVTDAGPPQEDLVNAAVAEIAQNRATIEQAKGMLMLIYEEILPPRATFDHLLLTAHLRVGTTEAAARTAS